MVGLLLNPSVYIYNLRSSLSITHISHYLIIFILELYGLLSNILCIRLRTALYTRMYIYKYGARK